MTNNKKDTVVYVPINPEEELPTEEGYYRTTGNIMSAYFHLDKGEKGQFEYEYQFEYWLKPILLSELVEDKNFPIRLRALIDRKMSESKIQDVLLKGSDDYDKYSDLLQIFFDSLDTVTIDQLLKIKTPH